jgi:ABC-2 type transport system ATP-binding protein
MLARLRAIGTVTSVSVEAREQQQILRVQSTGERELTAQLMAELAGVEVGRVSTREPTLEDAYVALVGAAT